MDEKITLLQQQINATEIELRRLKDQLARTEEQSAARRNHESSSRYGLKPNAVSLTRRLLSGEEYKRYGRQMIMPEIGLEGQIRLKNSRILIIGLGGLGSPAAAYLAGAGVGTIGLMDGDSVELSNLHRQVVHNEQRLGMGKISSAYQYLHDLNPLPKYDMHQFHLTPSTALSTFSQYDLVLDCTDHPTSRYLISDACVLSGKPLVSASALRTEGQLIVLNNPPRPPSDSKGGPCYRCIWPKPPPAESVLSCGEGGILGPVVGVMGVLQALEAIKLLTAAPEPPNSEPARPSMLLFSAYSSPPFRSIRLRSRHASCAVCSSKATINPDSLTSGSLDYVAFCGVTTPVDILPAHSRTSAADFAKLREDSILIDVRDPTQFSLCSLPGSVNVPWKGNARRWVDDARDRGVLSPGGQTEGGVNQDRFIVCRFGNDSQMVVQAIQDAGLDGHSRWKDIIGGLRAWREEVDEAWPEY